MKIELHVLQNFPPSCLNRDDTNSPKDCEFGGVRRARISSQSLKRAMREYFRLNSTFPADEETVRTKRVVEFVTAELERLGHTGETVPAVIELLLQVGSLKIKDDDEDRKTQYLLFLPRKNLVALADLAHRNWSKLEEVVSAATKAATPADTKASKEAKDVQGAKKSKQKEKKDARKSATEALGDLGDQVEDLLFGSRHAPELALFGRMIADAPEHNVDAACQVAHAISTHRVAMEFDFYTAVDDLKRNDNQGADMMGTTQFNSACFYKYSVLDLPQLARTLAGIDRGSSLSTEDRRRARTAALAYVDAAINAVPSARQNGMAAWTKPSLVLTASRAKGQPLSLANAFVKPVRAAPGTDVVEESATALSTHLTDLGRMYGTDGTTFRFVAERESLKLADRVRMNSVPELLKELEADLTAWVEQGGEA